MSNTKKNIKSYVCAFVAYVAAYRQFLKFNFTSSFFVVSKFPFTKIELC